MKTETKRIFSDEFKWQIVQDVLNGKYTKEEARRLHKIKGKSAVLYWMRKFSGGNGCIKNETPSDTAFKIKQMKELSDQDKRINELEAQIKIERLRADLWQKMVEIAEEQLNLDIVKKFGAKPSVPSRKSKAKK